MKLYYLIFIFCLVLSHCSTTSNESSSEEGSAHPSQDDFILESSDPRWINKEAHFTTKHVGVVGFVRMPSTQSVVQCFLQSDDAALKDFLPKLYSSLRSLLEKHFIDFGSFNRKFEKSFTETFQEEYLLPTIDRRYYKEFESSLLCFSLAIFSKTEFQGRFNKILERHFLSSFESRDIFEKTRDLFWKNLFMDQKI